MHPKLQSIVDSLSVLQKVIPDDACMLVADMETVIAYLPGQDIDIKVPVGAPVEKFRGTVSYRALDEGIFVQDERGPEQFGVSYISTAMPIFDESDQVIGAVSTIVSNQKYDTIRNSTSELAAMVEELSATTDEVANSTTEIADSVNQVVGNVELAVTQAEKIDGIANFVKEIASQSNLLGLNAAIEASRAGDMGRGFAVVAQEIRKMADQSKDATKEIAIETTAIINFINDINTAIELIAKGTAQNAASMQELRAVFEHIAQTADGLASIASSRRIL